MFISRRTERKQRPINVVVPKCVHCLTQNSNIQYVTHIHMMPEVEDEYAEVTHEEDMSPET